MKFYCFDCSCLICRDCTVEDHLGHKYQSIKKAAPGLKTSLKERLSPLRDMGGFRGVSGVYGNPLGVSQVFPQLLFTVS